MYVSYFDEKYNRYIQSNRRRRAWWQFLGVNSHIARRDGWSTGKKSKNCRESNPQNTSNTKTNILPTEIWAHTTYIPEQAIIGTALRKISQHSSYGNLSQASGGTRKTPSHNANLLILVGSELFDLLTLTQISAHSPGKILPGCGRSLFCWLCAHRFLGRVGPNATPADPICTSRMIDQIILMIIILKTESNCSVLFVLGSAIWNATRGCDADASIGTVPKPTSGPVDGYININICILRIYKYKIFIYAFSAGARLQGPCAVVRAVFGLRYSPAKAPISVRLAHRPSLRLQCRRFESFDRAHRRLFSAHPSNRLFRLCLRNRSKMERLIKAKNQTFISIIIRSY